MIYKFFRYLVLISLIAIVLAAQSCGSSRAEEEFSLDGIAKAYEEKFEKEASSVTHNKISSHKSEIVSTYQVAGMTAFTNLYFVKDSRGKVYTIAFSTHCPRQGSCELLIDHAKVFDQDWKDVTSQVLPLKEVKEKLGEARKRPDYNEPGREVDGFFLQLPESASGELTFTLTPTSEFDPSAGNSYFEVSHCKWNPDSAKCETFEKEYELSP